MGYSVFEWAHNGFQENMGWTLCKTCRNDFKSVELAMYQRVYVSSQYMSMQYIYIWLCSKDQDSARPRPRCPSTVPLPRQRPTQCEILYLYMLIYSDEANYSWIGGLQGGAGHLVSLGLTWIHLVWFDLATDIYVYVHVYFRLELARCTSRNKCS